MTLIADLTIQQGATWDQPVQLVDDSGTAIDITGFTASLEAKSSPTDCYVYLSISTTTGEITLPTPTTGTFYILVPPSITSNLTCGVYLYNMLAVSPSGYTFRLLEGTLTVSPEV